MINPGYGMWETRLRISNCRKLPLGVPVWCAPTFMLATPQEVSSKSVTCGGREARVPVAPDKDHPLPVVVLLHGAGDRAGNMIEAWKGFAEKQKIVLLARELPRDPKFEDAAPQAFRCVVEADFLLEFPRSAQ